MDNESLFSLTLDVTYAGSPNWDAGTELGEGTLTPEELLALYRMCSDAPFRFSLRRAAKIRALHAHPLTLAEQYNDVYRAMRALALAKDSPERKAFNGA